MAGNEHHINQGGSGVPPDLENRRDGETTLAGLLLATVSPCGRDAA